MVTTDPNTAHQAALLGVALADHMLYPSAWQTGGPTASRPFENLPLVLAWRCQCGKRFDADATGLPTFAVPHIADALMRRMEASATATLPRETEATS